MNGLGDFRNAGLQDAARLAEQWAENYKASAEVLKAREALASDDFLRRAVREARDQEERNAAVALDIAQAIRGLVRPTSYDMPFPPTHSHL